MLFRSLSVLITLLMFGCFHPSSTNDKSVSDGNDKPKLTATLLIKDKFNQEQDVFLIGEDITFEIIVTNNSESDVTYQVTEPGYNFFIIQDEFEIWSAFYNNFFPGVIVDRTINANESLIISEKWDGKNNEGDSVEPGMYMVTSHLVFFVDETLVTVPPSIEITLI